MADENTEVSEELKAEAKAKGVTAKKGDSVELIHKLMAEAYDPMSRPKGWDGDPSGTKTSY